MNRLRTTGLSVIFMTIFLVSLFPMTSLAEDAEIPCIKWVLVDTSVNPNNELTEFRGGGYTPGYYTDARYDGKFDLYDVSETKFGVHTRQWDRGLAWDVNIDCSFEAPPLELVPGQSYNLIANFTHRVTEFTEGPRASQQFHYYSDDPGIGIELPEGMYAGNQFLYSPWDQNFTGENSKTWTLDVVAKGAPFYPGPGATWTLVAGWRAVPCCYVAWTYEAQEIPCGAAESTACNWTGTWDTSWGMMDLVQTGNQVTGTYGHQDGRITGTASGSVLTGTWSEAPSHSPPNDAGDFEFTMSSDCNSFTGRWRYDSTGGWDNWTGTRIGSPVSTPTPGSNGAGIPNVTTNSPEADCIVLIGDIDNLGFGWPPGFDVFSGNSTPVHPYPWDIDPTDAPGTDRIMLGTSNDGRVQDGYSRTSRPDNLPQIISTSFNCPGVSINSAIIQMFVDDFQVPVWGSQFQVELNGTRAPFIESAINALSQTGPIGKLISLQVPSEYLYLFSSGNLSIYIDDPTTGTGDGYAVDFVRLLINPDLSTSSYTGMITGTVKDAQTGQPLRNAKVSAGGTADTQTNSSGAYTLSRVPAGLVVVSASLPGYINGSTTADLVAGGNATANISLEPLPTGTGDTDGDGVPDNQDQCPNTPSGDTVGSNGCPTSGTDTDSDNDGIPDSSDQCPNTPVGTSVGVDGCQTSGGAAASLVVESRTVIPGGTVSVPVRLQNVRDVGSLNFNITYDPSVVSTDRIDKGSLLSGVSFVANQNETGIIRFGFATVNGVSGTGPIGYIVCSAVGSAGNSTRLTISGVEATDSSGNPITLQTVNGSVTIDSDRVIGDSNGDGVLTELDALAALRMSVNLLAEDLILDIDKNEKVTAEDARRILSIAVRGR